VAIIEMKRISFVCPADTGEALLRAVQGIALLDPVPLAEEAEPPSELAARQQAVQRVIGTLEARRRELKREAPEPVQGGDRERGQEVVAEVEGLLARRAELDNRLAHLNKDRDLIAPWGGIDPADLELLAGRDVHLELYTLAPEERAQLALPEGIAWSREVAFAESRDRRVGLAVLGLDGPVELELDRASLPDRPLAEIQQEMAEVEGELEQSRQILSRLTGELPAVKRYARHLQDRESFARVRSEAGGDEELFALAGWCPAESVEALRESVADLPVVVLVKEPDRGDDVPIKLRNGPLVRLFQPLLRAFNLPGYEEYDPTPFIAPFMGIFFGFCLGDLGYGVILVAAAWAALARFRPEGEARLAVQWLMLLGVSTMVIGGLTGNAFGVQLYKVFGWSPSAALFSLNADPKKFFYASLVFGAVQLTVGMLIRLAREVQLQRWQRVVGQIGWLAVLPTAGAWAWTGSGLPFAVTLAVILLFASPSPSLARRLGGGAWALYNITGLFGDVMSYARIFGLGLSSGIIAMVVNTIAMTVAESVPLLGWPLAILVLVAGHAFNFVMALIGSVVHPARLQFLEFFGKFFDGGGRPYTPFSKQEGD